MKTATGDLENDHVQILRLTDVMELMTGRTDLNPDPDDLESVVSLIRNYADGLHHAKEEEVLFPALGERGFSSEQGPVAVMLSEHTAGREFVRGMDQAIRQLRDGDASASARVFENMSGYVNLLRNHIAKENNILFRMADRLLSDDDHRLLLERYGSVTSRLPNGGDSSVYISEISRLEEKYR